MKLHSYWFLFEHDGFLTEMAIWTKEQNYNIALEKAREQAKLLGWKLRDDLPRWTDIGFM